MDKAFGCVYLRWATADGGENETEVVRLFKENDRTVAGKLFEAILFQSILSTVHVVRVHTAVHLSTTELPKAGYRFHINRFFRKSQMSRK